MSGSTAPVSPICASGGLTEASAQERLVTFGPNEIVKPPPGALHAFFRRLWGPIPWLLEAALFLEVALGKAVESAIIGGWLVFSALVGSMQERRAHAALDLLRGRLHVEARVLRGGSWRRIAARDLVPGDRVGLTAGDLVPADCTVEEGAVEADQSALTGESAAVSRDIGETLYSGSTIRGGRAEAIVTETGARSYFGRTAELVRTAGAASHLERLLFAVVRQLVSIDAALAVLLVAVALWRGEALLPLIPFFLVLLTATVPVTMPAAFTAANALEARNLAKEGVLVTGLSSVQEAASLDVLCVDKTGTLTLNRQTIAAVVPLAGETEDGVLAFAAAACDDSTQSVVDGLILALARKRALTPLTREAFIPFDPAAKRSEAVLRPTHEDDAVRVVLGSPAVIGMFADAPPDFTAKVEELAVSGARLLAVAAGVADRPRIRGLIALADPLRPDAASLVAKIEGLGIRVLMVTGDTRATAEVVAKQVGLGARFGDASRDLDNSLDFDGFANFYPEEKFRLVKTLQQTGRIVGMTGDGVNDAPVLKQAEVGIAVQDASDVAKAAAGIVLTRPGLEGIVSVVSGGRRVFRRMLTWTITKVARTVELAALLTFGYIATGFFVVPLTMIVVITVLNDIVTLTLATDRAWVSPAPEQWDIGQISRRGAALAAGWLILGFAVLWLALHPLHLPIPQIHTLMFVYLMYTAQVTIWLTRTPGHFWSLPPSGPVMVATIGNIVIASLMAGFGLLTAPVSFGLLVALLLAVLLAALLFDQLEGLKNSLILRP
ncbi:divalent cation transporter [Gluconobacter oxydans]|nr:divalent cation transporter [Gluconobacter oxydans]